MDTSIGKNAATIVVTCFLMSLYLGHYAVALLLPMMLLGATLNRIVRAMNGGKMPVRTFDAEKIEQIATSEIHCIASENTKLLFLGDVIPLPFRIHVSIGDVLIQIGVWGSEIYFFGLIVLMLLMILYFVVR